MLDEVFLLARDLAGLPAARRRDQDPAPGASASVAWSSVVGRRRRSPVAGRRSPVAGRHE